MRVKQRRSLLPGSVRLTRFLLLPAAIFLAAVFLFPLLNLLTVSLFDPSFTLKHYLKAFATPVYARVLWHTLLIGLTTTGICLVLGFPVAMLIARVSERTRNVLLLMVVLPYFTSILVRSYAWLVLLGKQGLVNELARHLRLVDRPLALIYNDIGVLIGMSHIMLPIMVLVLYAVMRGIDEKLVKVSSSLGARQIQTFFRVYLPLTLPGVGAGCILVFIISIGYYITPALLGGLRSTMLAMLIATRIETLLDWGFAGALSVILLVVTLAIFLLFNRILGLDQIWGGVDLTRAANQPQNYTEMAGGHPSNKRPRTGIVDGLLTIIEDAVIFATSVIHGLRELVRTRIFGSTRTRRHRHAPANVALWIISSVVLLFLLAPIVLIFPVSFTSSLYLQFPPRGWSLKWYKELVDVAFWRESFVVSLQVGLATAALAGLLGTLAAIALVREQFAGKNLAYTLLLLPLIVPVIVIAVALYYSFARMGLAGTIMALVLGHTLGAIPLVVLVIASALKGVDPSLENAAMSLGASQLRAFLQITLQIIRPALGVAAFFAFIHSFDEVVIASFLGGISVETLPKKMWEGVHLEIKPTLAAAASLMILLTCTIMVLVEVMQHLSRRMHSQVGVSRK